MNETELSRDIQDALESLGAVVVRVQSGQLRGAAGNRVRAARAGTPDLWVAFRGFDSWLEVKTDTGSLNSEQETWHAEARQHGARVHIVRSVEQALRIVRGS